MSGLAKRGRQLLAIVSLTGVPAACGGGDFTALEIALSFDGTVAADQVRLGARIGATELLSSPALFPTVPGGDLRSGDTIAVVLPSSRAGSAVTVTAVPMLTGAASGSEVTAVSPPLVALSTVRVVVHIGAPAGGDGGPDGVADGTPGADGSEGPDAAGGLDGPPDSAGDPATPADSADAAPDGASEATPDARPDSACLPTGPCDPVCQSGCISAQECVVSCSAPIGPRCVPNFGSTPFNGACMSGPDSCDRGLVCLPNAACGSRCERYCRSDGDCPSGYGCDRQISCGMTPAAKVCFKICDPTGAAAGSACPGATDGCYPASPSIPGPSMPQPTLCRCKGATPAGSTCSLLYECVPGFICVDSGAGPRCEQVCELYGANPCPSPRSCAPITDWNRWGVCLI